MVTDFRGNRRGTGRLGRIPQPYRPADYGRRSGPAAPHGGRRRLLRRGVVLGVGTVGAVVAWVGATGLLARGELTALQAEAGALQRQLAGADIGSAAVTAQSMRRHADRAHRLTGGPAWAVAAGIPGVGGPLGAVRGIAAVANELGAHALPGLIAAAPGIEPGKLRGADGRIDVEAIGRLAPAVDAAAASIRRAEAIAGRVSAHTWSASADRATELVRSQLLRLARGAQDAGRAVHVLPVMLGADRPRTYFLAFQNDAEARGTGGLPGAFAIVRASRGQVSFERFESDETLLGVTAGVDLGPEYDDLYANAATTTIYRNSNISPHFPDAARIWSAMWARKSGQHVDGALAVDPEAMSYLLAVTGPAHLPDGTTVSADNVVELTQSTSYLRFGKDQAGRKKFLNEVAHAVSEKITTTHSAAAGMVRALAHAADERRLLVWSADPGLQTQLEATPLAGVVPITAAPYAGMAIVNEGGNKLDYYLDRSLDWEAKGCNATREVTVTIRLTNSVPAGLTNTYVTDRSDHRDYPIRIGDNRVTVYYAATNGAVLHEAALDDEQAFAGVAFERGHPMFTVDVELPARSTRTLVLRLTEPRTGGTPIVPLQPLVRPMGLTLHVPRCH